MKIFPTNSGIYQTKNVNNLDGIAVGDVLMRNEQGRWDSDSNYVKVTCTHVTPKQATIGNTKYRKEDARQVGGCGIGELMNVDEAVLLESRRARQLCLLRRKLSDTDWNKINDVSILDITNIIDKHNRTKGSE